MSHKGILYVGIFLLFAQDTLSGPGQKQIQFYGTINDIGDGVDWVKWEQDGIVTVVVPNSEDANEITKLLKSKNKTIINSQTGGSDTKNGSTTHRKTQKWPSNGGFDFGTVLNGAYYYPNYFDTGNKVNGSGHQVNENIEIGDDGYRNGWNGPMYINTGNNKNGSGHQVNGNIEIGNNGDGYNSNYGNSRNRPMYLNTQNNKNGKGGTQVSGRIRIGNRVIDEGSSVGKSNWSNSTPQTAFKKSKSFNGRHSFNGRNSFNGRTPPPFTRRTSTRIRSENNKSPGRTFSRNGTIMSRRFFYG